MTADTGWQYKQAPQSIAVVKIAHAKKYLGEPKFSINAAHRSNVASILAGARRHPENVRHPDLVGRCKTLHPTRCGSKHDRHGNRERRVGQDFNGDFRYGSRLCENADEPRTRRIVFSIAFF
jgi:hypothetical protein